MNNSWNIPTFVAGVIVVVVIVVVGGGGVIILLFYQSFDMVLFAHNQHIVGSSISRD